MKKKSLLLVIILLLIILGALGYAVKKGLLGGAAKNALTGLSNKGIQVSTDQTAGDMLKGTFEQILAAGKSVKCTFAEDKDGSKVESTTFVFGEKFRTDSEVTDSDNAVNDFHMVSDGTYAYMWGSDQEAGIKMNLSEYKKDTQDGQNTEGANKAFDIREAMKAYNYECKPWVPDVSKFAVPTNIEFQDLSAMMKGLEGLTKEMCTQCDKLETADEVAGCKASLKCN